MYKFDGMLGQLGGDTRCIIVLERGPAVIDRLAGPKPSSCWRAWVWATSVLWGSTNILNIKIFEKKMKSKSLGHEGMKIPYYELSIY